VLPVVINWLFIVAPYAGAWIETGDSSRNQLVAYVAPYAGAWIETRFLYAFPLMVLVAPYAGAWIETQPETQ